MPFICSAFVPKVFSFSSKVWSWIAVVPVNRKLWARACISRRHNCSFPSKWKFWYQNFSIHKSQHWKPAANNSSMVRFSTDKSLEFSILMEVPMLKLFHPEVLTSEWCSGQIFQMTSPLRLPSWWKFQCRIFSILKSRHWNLAVKNSSVVGFLNWQSPVFSFECHIWSWFSF